MTGIPMIAIGPKRGNAYYFPGVDLYEVSDLIDHGVNGFCSDNPAELQACIRELLVSDGLAERISKAGRAEAIRHFNKDMISASWGAFLGS